MLRTYLYAKIRDIRITGLNLEYQGSILLDAHYLDESGIAEYEQVHVVNIENGNRLITYTLRAEPGSGVVELNGAAARCGMPGDRIMVLSYCSMRPEDAILHEPKVLSFRNRPEPVGGTPG